MIDERTREEQIEDLMDHYEDPRHYGTLTEPSVVEKGTNPGCGDVITVYLKVGPDEKIESLTFEGDGCTISQAAASMAMELAAGKTIKEIEDLPQDYMMEVVGKEIALTRPKCSTLGLNILREAIRHYRRNQVLKEDTLPGDPHFASGDGHSCPSH